MASNILRDGDLLAGAQNETVIEDVRHPALRRVAEVMRSSGPHPRSLIVDDEENIIQAIAAGVEIDALYATLGAVLPEGLQCHATPVPRYLVGATVMKDLFKAEKRSRVFALARAPEPATLPDVAGRGGDVIVLDGVRLAGNIGAIVRSACAFDAAGVILIASGLRNVFDRRLIRASRGLAFSIPIIPASYHELAGFLRAEGIPLASLDADADLPLSAISGSSKRIALLMGSERTGASPDLERLADWRCSVPMSQRVESLNVSVAAGIAVYERRRHKPSSGVTSS
jgi:TrmH family RNA methyltransferase